MRQPETVTDRSTSQVIRILESITDGFFALDHQWRIVYANRRSGEILGRDDLIGSNLTLWEIYPNLSESEFGRAYRTAAETKTPQHVEAFYPALGKWFEAHAYPSAEGLSIYFRDVSRRRMVEEELRERQARFELVARASQEMIYEANLQTRETWRSDALETVFGFPPAIASSRFEWWLERIHEQDRRRIVDSIEASIAGDADFWSGEYRLQSGDGRLLNVLDRATILRDPEGKAERIIGTRMDVTQRRAAEEELRSSREQARRLARRLITVQEEERGRIARDIHDVLGQALTSMKIAAVSLGRAPGLTEPERERAKRIADLVDETVKDVRAMSTRLRPIVLDDLGLLPALQAEARAFSERTGIPCGLVNRVRKLEPDAELSTAIFRIVQEALTNVARHSGAGEARVEIYEREGALHVEVHDDGRGIAFGQRNASSSLGLIGMMERAFLVGGELTVRAASDRGTIVSLVVPATRSSTAEPDGTNHPS